MNCSAFSFNTFTIGDKDLMSRGRGRSQQFAKDVWYIWEKFVNRFGERLPL